MDASAALAPSWMDGHDGQSQLGLRTVQNTMYLELAHENPNYKWRKPTRLHPTIL